MLSLLPGFILKLLGSGIIEKVLDHKRKLLDTATEQQRIKLQGEIAVLEAEKSRKARIAELQALEYQRWETRLVKMMLGFPVAVYVSASFIVAALNLTGDFNIVVPDLNAWQQAYALGVSGYYFLSK